MDGSDYPGGALYVAPAYCPPEVEIGQPAHVNSLLALLRDDDEDAIGSVSDECLAYGVRAASNRNGAIIGVQRRDSRIVGAVGLCLTWPWYSDAPHWQQMFCFVHPDHRSGDDAPLKNLLTFCKWWSFHTGTALVVAAGTGPSTAGKHRLFERMFGKRIGGLFCDRGRVGVITRPSEVEFLQAGAEEECLAFLLEFSDSALALVSLSKAREALYRATEGRGGAVGIVRHEGKIIGSIGLDISPQWNSKEWVCAERWCFSRNAVGSPLLQFAKWYAADIGVPLVGGVIQRHKTEAKLRFFRRHLPQVASLFLYNEAAV